MRMMMMMTMTMMLIMTMMFMIMMAMMVTMMLIKMITMTMMMLQYANFPVQFSLSPSNALIGSLQNKWPK